MTVERGAGGSVRVLHGSTLVAGGTCLPGSLDVELPGPVRVAEARAAGARSRPRTHPQEHPFPSCFVCGPHRQPGDGLRILAGPVAGRDLSADVWYPDESLAQPDGYLRPEFVWAAPDCARAIGASGDAPGAPAYVLGRFSARQIGLIKTGEPHVVAGWRLAEDGRKLLAGSALFTAAVHAGDVSATLETYGKAAMDWPTGWQRASAHRWLRGSCVCPLRASQEQLAGPRRPPGRIVLHSVELPRDGHARLGCSTTKSNGKSPPRHRLLPAIGRDRGRAPGPPEMAGENPARTLRIGGILCRCEQERPLAEIAGFP